MPIFDVIPSIVRVFLVFILILFAIKRRLSLGNAFFSGSIVMGLMFGMTPLSMIHSIFASLTHPKTLSLGVIVSLILVLSHSMELAGQMTRLLDRFQGLVVRPKINLVIFPALIGLLPMPGGAIFSAPMVKSLGRRQNLSNDQLSFINYWFRHIWEYWWPLYPGVLLTTTLANLDLWVFVLFLFPLTSMALLVGYRPLKILGKHNGATGDLNPHSRPALKPFIKELAPVLIAIGLGLGSGAVLSVVLQPYGTDIAKEIGLILALLLAIIWVWRVNGLSVSKRLKILKEPQLWQLFYMVAAILVFKGMLEDSHAVEGISKELLRWHVPLMPITVILPFLVGGVVGITIAFVGTTFPILISLIHSFGESQSMLAYMMLALVSGFMGVLLSPLHLCLLLSNEYFGASLTSVYRHLWAPCIFLLLTGCAYFWILHGLIAP